MTSTKRKKAYTPTVYWDTCVLLAWIKDEKRSAGQMENLYSVATEIHEKRMNLITSVAATGEIYLGTLSREARDKLEDLFKRRNIERVNIDENVQLVTAELMEYYRAEAKKDDRPPLCYADAQHLAVAIINEVDEFHTFDRDDKKGCRGLLGLSGNVGGHHLIVCMPQTDQVGLL